MSTVHYAPMGRAVCGSPATKALAVVVGEVTCVPCQRQAYLVSRYEPAHLVIATLGDGGETETEVFGPFPSNTAASAWCDRFEEWWKANVKPGGRTIEHLLVTRTQDPAFIDSNLVTRSDDPDKDWPEGTRNIPLCSCGALVPPDSPAEDEHFVFAVRQDGTRSNLGWCPEKDWGKAVMQARSSLSGAAMYRGVIV